jgi:hypothetical protein
MQPSPGGQSVLKTQVPQTFWKEPQPIAVGGHCEYESQTTHENSCGSQYGVPASSVAHWLSALH